MNNKVHALVKTFKTTAVEVVLFLGKNRPKNLNSETV